MSEITVTVLTNQGAREVTFEEQTHVGTAITEVLYHIGLPRTSDIRIRWLPPSVKERRAAPRGGRPLDETSTLRAEGVDDGDVLSIRPAGGPS